MFDFWWISNYVCFTGWMYIRHQHEDRKIASINLVGVRWLIVDDLKPLLSLDWFKSNIAMENGPFEDVLSNWTLRYSVAMSVYQRAKSRLASFWFFLNLAFGCECFSQWPTKNTNRRIWLFWLIQGGFYILVVGRFCGWFVCFVPIVMCFSLYRGFWYTYTKSKIGIVTQRIINKTHYSLQGSCYKDLLPLLKCYSEPINRPIAKG